MPHRLGIIVTLEVPGMHSWPNAPIQYAYLRQPHRHMFHITGAMDVTHGDRDVEFIDLKHRMLEFFLDTYDMGDVGYAFGSLSCEQIASQLLDEFDLRTCTVLEDGENGAIVVREA